MVRTLKMQLQILSRKSADMSQFTADDDYLMVRDFDKNKLHVGFLHASPIIWNTGMVGIRAPD